jgi:hypothetical protein
LDQDSIKEETQLTGILLEYNLLVEKLMNQTISLTIEFFGDSMPRKEAKNHQHTSILEMIWPQQTKTKSRLFTSTLWILLLSTTRKLKNQPRVIKTHYSMESGRHQRSLHTGKTPLSNLKSILVSPVKRRRAKKKRKRKKSKRKEVMKIRRMRRKLTQKKKLWRALIHINTLETPEIMLDGLTSQHFSSET